MEITTRLVRGLSVVYVPLRKQDRRTTICTLILEQAGSMYQLLSRDAILNIITPYNYDKRSFAHAINFSRINGKIWSLFFFHLIMITFSHDKR